jgi:hypothetical protein
MAQVPARTGAFEAYKTTSLLFAWAAAANAKLSKIANEYDMNLGKCAIFLGPPSEIGWTHRRDSHEGEKVSFFCALVF